MKLLEKILKNIYFYKYRIAQKENLFFVEQRMFLIIFPYWYEVNSYNSYIDAERSIRYLTEPNKKIIKYYKPYKIVEIELENKIIKKLYKICKKEDKIIDEVIEDLLQNYLKNNE